MRLHLLLGLAAACLFLSGCSSSDAAVDDPATTVEVDPSLFVQSALTGVFTEESCVLSGGTTATCYRFSVTTVPTDHTAGPRCPQTITDDATAGGIWPEGGIAHDVDGPFIANLSTFYNDATWKMYDASGVINVTDSPEACAAAARPDVDPAYTNFCVQCETSYIESGAQTTFIIPKHPVVAQGFETTGNPVGVALNGVSFDPPAPTDAILGAYTLAPFDDCGGHVNLIAGYHYHAATGCGTKVEQSDGHASMIGYALDGFPFHSQLNEDGLEPTDLDECRGHEDETRGYHYHVASPGANTFVGCFKGEHGCAFEGDGSGETCDATTQIGPGPPRGGAFPSPHEHH